MRIVEHAAIIADTNQCLGRGVDNGFDVDMANGEQPGNFVNNCKQLGTSSGKRVLTNALIVPCLVTLTVTTIHSTKKTQEKSSFSPQYYDFHFPHLVGSEAADGKAILFRP